MTHKKKYLRGTGSFKRFIYLSCSLLLLVSRVSFAEFPEMPDADYQQFLKEFKLKPTLLADKPELVGKLSPDQLSGAIEYLGLSHYSFLHPVLIKGEEVPAILNQPIKDYSIMSVRGGQLVPVPFQFDEKDTKGFVYLEDHAKLEGTKGIVDPNDEVVFV